MLIELVEYNVCVYIALELDNDAHAVSVGLVAKIRYAVDFFLVHKFGDALNKPCLINLIRYLRHDNTRAVRLELVDFGLGPCNDATAAGRIRASDAACTHDDAAGREVWAFDILHQLVDGNVRIVNKRRDGVNCFAQVMRRYVRGHAHGDTARAVYQ
ncbi:hypothetical protein SDC9_154910 [bioreactor metagenome]|uniref:Uncharacterized protein n=1 Tax=bioreactor metagenome TaxID=1076179 RepID=A0A645F2I4_9ZZZZ